MDAESEDHDAVMPLARKIGSRLDALLETLRTATPLRVEARTNWDQAHWDHWAQVQSVGLAGALRPAD